MLGIHLEVNSNFKLEIKGSISTLNYSGDQHKTLQNFYNTAYKSFIRNEKELFITYLCICGTTKRLAQGLPTK